MNERMQTDLERLAAGVDLEPPPDGAAVSPFVESLVLPSADGNRISYLSAPGFDSSFTPPIGTSDPLVWRS